MGQIVKTSKRRRRWPSKYIWMLSAATAVSALLYWEQTALLYVVSTLLLCGLLLAVAFADLEGSVREGLRRIRATPLLADVETSGWIYDVETGRLHEVADEA